MSFSRPTAPFVSGGDSVFFPATGVSVWARKLPETYGDGIVGVCIRSESGSSGGAFAFVVRSGRSRGSGGLAGSGGAGARASARMSTTAAAETCTRTPV